MKTGFTILALLLVTSSAARAADVRVSVEGTVVSNEIGAPPLGDVVPGEHVALSFDVGPPEQCCDEENCSGVFCRYPIDETTFALGFDGGVMVGLAGPSALEIARLGGPGAENPGDYCILAGSLAQEPVGIVLQLRFQPGTFGSIDILDLLGEYDVTELLEFVFGLWVDDPTNVVAEFDFERIAFEAIQSTPTHTASWGEVKRAFRMPGE